jgi:superfamily II DNA or RNA helicase
MKEYQDFIQQKVIKSQASGISINDNQLNKNLFSFQRDLVKLALKQGKFCLWTNTGTGKGLMLMSWAEALITTGTVTKVLVLAPLGVAKQLVGEGTKFGILINYCIDDTDVIDGINVTNYEKLHKFDTSAFDAVVLDEASILKNVAGKVRREIIDTFRNTTYKLACSATPSPNDYMELGNQCEFLGVMSYNEMLSMFFVHDGGETSKWILKPHAQKAFWEFVCSWAVMLRMPSDLGYSDNGYILPKLTTKTHLVNTQINPPDGQLLFTDYTSLLGQRHIRKSSLQDRCRIAADIANNSDEQVLVWCETNDESALLNKLIHVATEVKGSDSDKHKEDSAYSFAQGNIRVLISKPSIFGMGLNFQRCHTCIYVGLSHSFEQFYQSVRRLWRFGQQNEVTVHIIQHHMEGSITANLSRKEDESNHMAGQMVKHMQTYSLGQLTGVKRVTVEYNPKIDMIVPDWLMDEGK